MTWKRLEVGEPVTEIPLVARFRVAAEIGRGDGSTKSSRAMASALDEGADLIEQQAAMLKAAVEALEPFAAVAAKLNPELPDDTPVTLSLGGGAIYVYALSRFRKARNALASLKQPGGS